MKTKQTSILLIFGIIAIVPLLLANWNGPQSAVSGSPLEGGNDCTQCHSGTANSGTGHLEIAGLSEYTPGNTYAINFNVNDESSSKFGFQAIAVDGDNNAVGTFETSSTTKFHRTDGINYIEHSTPSSDGKFSVNWTAPSTDVGDITFYAAGNASNGNNKVSGDKIYTANLTISGMNTGISNEVKFNDYLTIKRYGQAIVISSVVANKIVSLNVYDLSGSKVYSINNMSTSQSLTLKNGIYLIQAHIDGNYVSKKISI